MYSPYASIRNSLVVTITIVRLRRPLLKHPKHLSEAVARIHIVAVSHPRADEPLFLEVVIDNTKELVALFVICSDEPWSKALIVVSPRDIAFPNVPLFVSVRAYSLGSECLFFLCLFVGRVCTVGRLEYILDSRTVIDVGELSLLDFIASHNTLVDFDIHILKPLRRNREVKAAERKLLRPWAFVDSLVEEVAGRACSIAARNEEVASLVFPRSLECNHSVLDTLAIALVVDSIKVKLLRLETNVLHILFVRFLELV